MFEINEKISVLAYFSQGNLLPKRFLWQKRTYAVEKINGFHLSKNGLYPIYNYALLSKGNIYEVVLEIEYLQWSIKKIYS